MKLQAVMNRSAHKRGTDLLDIVRLILDPVARPLALVQIGEVADPVAADVALHVDLWFARNGVQFLPRIRAAGGDDVTPDDVDLVAELLMTACAR